MSIFEDWFYKLFGEKAIRKFVGSIIRHALTGLAGYLSVEALNEPELAAQLEAAIVPIILYWAAQLWSFKQKKE
jgi:membrane protein DedA with SNARE-associated domain